MARVVVGVDDSDRARAALREAAVEARLRGATLEVIHVYEPPHRSLGDDLARIPPGVPTAAHSGPAPSRSPDAAERQRVLDELGAIVEQELGDASRRPDVKLVPIAAGETVGAIVDHAADADLLVIGLRRRSPVGKLVLGSDGRDILLGANCPVLAVKGPDPFEAAEASNS